MIISNRNLMKYAPLREKMKRWNAR